MQVLHATDNGAQRRAHRVGERLHRGAVASRIVRTTKLHHDRVDARPKLEIVGKWIAVLEDKGVVGPRYVLRIHEAEAPQRCRAATEGLGVHTQHQDVVEHLIDRHLGSLPPGTTLTTGTPCR